MSGGTADSENVVESNVNRDAPPADTASSANSSTVIGANCSRNQRL